MQKEARRTPWYMRYIRPGQKQPTERQLAKAIADDWESGPMTLLGDKATYLDKTASCAADPMLALAALNAYRKGG